LSSRPAASQSALHRAEDALSSAALLVMVLLPVSEIVVRRAFGRGIPGAGPIVQHLTLWVGFLGASIAARDGKLLALATGGLVPEGRWQDLARTVAAVFATAASIVLAWGGVQMVMAERDAASSIGAGIPTWMAECVLPFGLALIAFRLVWRSGGWWQRLIVAVLSALAVWYAQTPAHIEGASLWPFAVVAFIAAAAGTPLFAMLGGTAAYLFLHDGVTPATVIIETYSLTVSPTLAAIPLFTLAGFLLAEGKASDRLLRAFRAWFGWMPGGTAVVCTVLCSFMTVFSGGSGVTILALGGVLFPALVRDGYREKFALGLLTASGSLGLLLPPALPLILYAVVAQIPVEDIFIGGILPGVLLTLVMAGWSVKEGLQSNTVRYPFRWSEAIQSVWAARYELFMPVLVLVSILGGLATTVEAAALTVLYALIMQTLLHREVSRTDLLRAFSECATVVGGVLIILGMAVGLTNYLVGMEFPAKLVAWALVHIHSQMMFLLALNLFLLVVGWLMEIWAAIVVVVPLIVPLGTAFGVDPVHLGIIFIANLELGFLTPLVGLNIFLASYRFRRPIFEVCAAALPMMGILGVGVLIITYVPWLTTGLLTLMGRR
jgi:tripartite ATP-independent transporter DctM subunit